MEKPKFKTLADYKQGIAPGIWFSLHIKAALADHNGSYQDYEDFFKHICQSMGCDCETHCKEMLNKYQVSRYTKMVYKNGKKCGALYHSYLCHCEVDDRLGKPKPTFDEVYPLYAISEDIITPCSAPENLEQLSTRFPDLLIKYDLPTAPKKTGPSKKFRLVNRA